MPTLTESHREAHRALVWAFHINRSSVLDGCLPFPLTSRLAASSLGKNSTGCPFYGRISWSAFLPRGRCQLHSPAQRLCGPATHDRTPSAQDNRHSLAIAHLLTHTTELRSCQFSALPLEFGCVHPNREEQAAEHNLPSPASCEERNLLLGSFLKSREQAYYFYRKAARRSSFSS